MALKVNGIALIVLVACIVKILEATPAATHHSHSHHHGKEREEDGAFSPRDHNHEDGGVIMQNLIMKPSWVRELYTIEIYPYTCTDKIFYSTKFYTHFISQFSMSPL